MRRFRLARGLLRLILGRLFRVELAGASNLPRGPYLLAANHLSWLDPFLLLAWLPATPRIHFLGRRSAIHNRFWKRWILAFMGGVVPVESGHLDELSLVVARIAAAGGVVAIFPEGRTGPEESRLQPLRPGIARFAERTGVPVVPVGIGGSRELWGGKTIRLQVGPALAGASLEEIRRSLQAVLPAAPCPAGARPWGWLTNLLR